MSAFSLLYIAFVMLSVEVKYIRVFLLPTGLHADHVLPAVLERQEAGLRGDPPQPDPGQQGGRPALGPRHLLPQ